MHPPFVTILKKRGETPLQAIEGWKVDHPEYASLPASYAGRLDPMAEGKLLVLLGDECKRQEKYRGLDKEYEIEAVLDIRTDSSDVLGLVEVTSTKTRPTSHELSAILKKLSGPHTVPYPAFSSKTVNGKPLFLYTLEGTLDTITIPEHVENIYRAELLSHTEVSVNDLRSRVEKALAVVPHAPEKSMALGRDFRQDEIRACWNEVLSDLPERTFTLVSLRVTCASSTYMRSLAERIARELNTNGFALSIDRTKIGRYKKLGPFGFWTKQY